MHSGSAPAPTASAPRRAPAAPPVVAVWTAAVLAVLLVGGLATDTSSSWYEGLDLPAFQPPGAVFGIVWTILYALIALAGISATRAVLGTPAATPVLGLFAANLVLNVAWTWIFFQAHAPAVAGVEILALLATTVALVVRLRPLRPRAALALVPYALWVTFATVLTWTIAATN